MSIIVAIRKGQTAAIASDLQTTQGSTVVPGEMRVYPKKIHKVGDAYIGIVGVMSHHSVLRLLAKSKPEIFNFGSGDAIAETLREMHSLLKEEYFLLPSEDDNDQEYESSQISGLIVSKAGIYSFSSYREVTEYNSFWAAGSGIEYGLGALEVAYSSEQNAKAIAEIAVRAACRFDSSSGLPLESYELNLDQ
jgi:ATP-dependent protease HslVU (ClpYQ) peptidase subunit